ncbi:aspartate aminotransferase [Pandoraea anhela]|uniref:Aminotransferase n=1 Tax=Pandoraea anhela TaxID=2508295 RepID=A0A5E4VWG0_9BURK|nr:aspartate aminotransferase [Pandoraea anhela]
MKSHQSLPIRPLIAEMPTSPIRQVADAGFNKPDVLPLWFGEGDQPTADFICEAAVSALRAGRTFYGENRGLPALREEIARYISHLRGVAVDSDRITITPSGVNAIMIIMQCLLNPGDNIVMVSPVWPNCVTSAKVMSADVRCVSLQAHEGEWFLDIDEIARQCDERTRAIFFNSPSNPTGWMATAEDTKALLDLARRKNLWLIADEVYDRIVYDTDCSVSVLDFAQADDLVISINSFSKAWNMTGWRLGWLVTPPWLGTHLAKLNEANTSNPPVFIQEAGIVALREGEDIVRDNRARYAQGRELIIAALGNVPGVTLMPPQAAFYAFFRPEGMSDSLAFAQRLLAETGVGVAPGIAFGKDGEGWCRLCFAAGKERLQPALERLVGFLRR